MRKGEDNILFRGEVMLRQNEGIRISEPAVLCGGGRIVYILAKPSRSDLSTSLFSKRQQCKNWKVVSRVANGPLSVQKGHGFGLKKPLRSVVVRD